jgi:hypothetical protein
MSADNAYFVIHREENGEHTWSVAHGFMSPWVEQGTVYDPDYSYATNLFQNGRKFTTRESALIFAHDECQNDYIVEYGVVEAEYPPKLSVIEWASEKEKEQQEIRQAIREVEAKYIKVSPDVEDHLRGMDYRT